MNLTRDGIDIAGGAAAVLYPALQALNSTSRVLGPEQLEGIKEHRWDVQWGALTSAGVIVIESAPSSSYAGTWSLIATITWSAATKNDGANFTGALGATRARVSTAVVGDTVAIRQRGVRA